MCRHVKSIEIIEFGHAKAQEGVNGAKSEYCVDKQKINITRPYQAALREATGWRGRGGAPARAAAVLARFDGQPAVARARPREDYEDRVNKVYDELSWKIDAVRVSFTHGAATAPRRQGRRAQSEGVQGQRRPPRRRTSVELRDVRSGKSSTTTASGHDDAARRDLPRGRHAVRARCPRSGSARSSSRWRRRSRTRIASRTQLVAEAGTGTGKTFAYLVPALLYGGKVIVSTGTKTLQDQLFERDLPLVRDALAAPVTVALLKGRANYVCHYHLERAAREDRLPSRDDVRHLPKIVAFARASQRGDRAELADVPENASDLAARDVDARQLPRPELPASTATASCMKARKEALEADVVVVNHHLFFADVMLRDEGVAELLPNCNTVILDEAHQLPDTATLFFGEQVTAGQLAELARDAEIAARTAARDVPDLPDAAGELVPAVRKLRLAAGEIAGQVRARRGTRARRIRGSAGQRSPRRSIASPPSSRSSPSAARRSRRSRRARGRGRAAGRAVARRPGGRFRIRPTTPRAGSAGSTSRRTASSCRRRRCRSRRS